MRQQEQNYLLGAGTELSSLIDPPPFNPGKKQPYTPQEAVKRISTQVPRVATYVRSLPDLACPEDESVAKVILHPQYLSKSAFPDAVLESVRLHPIGSRSIVYKPEKVGRNSEPKEEVCTELFVAGKRSDFEQLSFAFGQTLQGPNSIQDQLPAIEKLDPMTIEDRIKPTARVDERIPIEVILHAGSAKSQEYRIDGLLDYARSLDLVMNRDHMVILDSLCFIGTYVEPQQLVEFSKYSYIRTVRRLTRLRTLHEPTRFYSLSGRIQLPSVAPIDNSPRVAIFDGGFDPASGLGGWVNAIDIPSVGAPIPQYVDHGVGVASAALFGPIEVNGQPLPSPAFTLDHYRVLGDQISGDFELLDVLNVIKDCLTAKKYDLVNISLGPNSVCDDGDVSPWSSTLDQMFADGHAIAFVAAGNNGEDDSALGYNRIMVPSDGVNVVGVGATDRVGSGWNRAVYSAVGPGRSPGVVKPDIVAFGGSDNHPYVMVSRAGSGTIWSSQGTSFASPTALRVAGQVLYHMGESLSPLAVRALLVHHADRGRHCITEVGRGLVDGNLSTLLTSDNSTCHIVYQGLFDPKKYVRFQIPEPDGGFIGKVELSLTVAYASEVDPASPDAYTRAGIEVFWRPNEDDIKDDAKYAQTKQLVQKKSIQTEQELRRDAHKWETIIQAKKSHLAKSLKNPVLDLHYNPRKAGGASDDAPPIPYVVIVSLRCKAMNDLYNRVLSSNQLKLQPLRPRIQIPI